MDEKKIQRQDLCNALEAVPTPVMAVDKDLNVMYMNLHGFKLLGLRSEDVIGKRCADLIRSHVCNTERCLAKRCFKENREFSGDTVAHLPRGDVPIRAAGAVMKGPEGEAIGFVEHIVDISKEARSPRR